MEHQQPVAGRRLRNLLQQPALATAGLRVQRDDTALAVVQPVQHRGHGVEVDLATDEGGVGEAAPLVEPADDQPRVGVARAQGGEQVEQVARERTRGLVALGRVLAQQPLQDEVECARGGSAGVAQEWHGRGQVLAQHVADGRSGERRRARHRLVQQDAERVEVGALVDRRREQAGGLRREVADRADELVADRLVEPGAARKAEVYERDGAVATEHHVGRLHVAVDDAGAVRDIEHAGHLRDDPERFLDRQRAVEQALLERAPHYVRLDEVEPVWRTPGVEQAGQTLPRELAQHLGLVLEAQPGRSVHAVRVDGLQDREGTARGVAHQPGLDAVAALERADRAIAEREAVQRLAGSGHRHADPQ